MGSPVSIEIRKQILDDKLINNISTKNIAKKYNVSESLVYKVLKENRETNMYKDLINVKDIIKSPNQISNNKPNILNTIIINNINIKCDDIILNKIIRELIR